MLSRSLEHATGEEVFHLCTDELLDGREGKATETKLERGAKLIRELLAICNQIKSNEEKRGGDIYGKG